MASPVLTAKDPTLNGLVISGGTFFAASLTNYGLTDLITDKVVLSDSCAFLKADNLTVEVETTSGLRT